MLVPLKASKYLDQTTKRRSRSSEASNHFKAQIPLPRWLIKLPYKPHIRRNDDNDNACSTMT